MGALKTELPATKTSAPACKSTFEKTRTSGNSELILSKAFEYYEKANYQHALTLFDLVLNTLRGDARAEKAYYQYAYCHYNTKQYLLAAFKGGHKDARIDLFQRPEAWSAETRKEVQRRLAAAGLYAGRATGFFDPRTRAAIEAYGRQG